MRRAWQWLRRQFIWTDEDREVLFWNRRGLGCVVMLILLLALTVAGCSLPWPLGPHHR